MKRLILAALVAAFAFPAHAQSLFGQTVVLKPLSPAYRLPYDANSRALTGKFSAEAEAVRLVCSTACFVQMAISGVTPIAIADSTTSSVYLPANVPEYMIVPRNGKVAAVRLSTDGVLFIQEFGR